TASIGVLLGWQAVSAIAVVAATAFFVSTLLGRAIRVMSRVPWFVWLTLATGLYIIFWRSIASTFWWLGSGARWPTCAVAAGIVLVVSVLTKIVTIEKTNCEPENEGN
ncbi:MAG: hypothetical protein QGF59_00160, partial [Pirellulaceae bacterium]|nr:hypothetical protein [Pirellulaceae bacterium]